MIESIKLQLENYSIFLRLCFKVVHHSSDQKIQLFCPADQSQEIMSCIIY